jgi:hypothetical protein
MVPYLFDLLGFFAERIVERGIGRGFPCMMITNTGVRLPRGVSCREVRWCAVLGCDVM